MSPRVQPQDHLVCPLGASCTGRGSRWRPTRIRLRNQRAGVPLKGARACMELGAGCDTGPECWGPAGLACPLTSGSSLHPSRQWWGGGGLSVLGAWSPFQLPAGDPLCKCHQVCALPLPWTARLPPLPVLESLVLAPTLDWESRGLMVTGRLGVPKEWWTLAPGGNGAPSDLPPSSSPSILHSLAVKRCRWPAQGSGSSSDWLSLGTPHSLLPPAGLSCQRGPHALTPV